MVLIAARNTIETLFAKNILLMASSSGDLFYVIYFMNFSQPARGAKTHKTDKHTNNSITYYI
jgi:hypothetical protein